MVHIYKMYTFYQYAYLFLKKSRGIPMHINELPIGVFDSGLGGLTAYKELHALLPAGDFVYFGDTGRVPYGSRSREILTRYARQDIRFLLRQGADVILAACGTVSSVVLDDIKSEFSIPLFGVVDASVNAALAATKNEKIGVIGTGGADDQKWPGGTHRHRRLRPQRRL